MAIKKVSMATVLKQSNIALGKFLSVCQVTTLRKIIMVKRWNQ